jgi:hypothetical protein
MKGMLNFLEKAGLVTRDAPAQPEPALPDAPPPAAAPLQPDVATPISTVSGAVADGVPMQLDSIYASAGVPASVYPAERLLRLVDGLAAMDEATRLMAIKAMDAADESWSIDDPLADAAAKVQALARHAEGLQHDLQTLESETQARLQAVAARQAQVVGDIRKQIAELEALVERELTRSAQETAAHEASLQAARQQTEQQVASLAQTGQRLQGLSRQFGSFAADRKE